MKYVLATAIGLLVLTGCKSECGCGCPYCCGGNGTDYNNLTNKPAPDFPIWWESKEDSK